VSRRSRTTALILAAGRGVRLAPLAGPVMLPLYRVDGDRPLVLAALDFARGFDVETTVVVANPVNRDAIAVLAVGASIATQAEPTGVIDAIAIGTEIDETARVLLLCADNLFDPGGSWFRERTDEADRSAIAVRVETDPTGRFTRLDRGWLYPRTVDREERARWVGPVLLATARLRSAIARRLSTVEMTLNWAGAPFRTITMRCSDRGVAAEEPTVPRSPLIARVIP
jgi:hypothetical protein